MPMYNPGTVVVEDFSEPLTRPDGSAEVFVYTHILYPGCTPGDATLSNTRMIELTKEEVDFVRQAQSTAPGQSVKELLGAAILSLLSQTHRIRGTFPDDYIPTLAAGVPT